MGAVAVPTRPVEGRWPLGGEPVLSGSGAWSNAGWPGRDRLRRPPQGRSRPRRRGTGQGDRRLPGRSRPVQSPPAPWDRGPPARPRAPRQSAMRRRRSGPPLHWPCPRRVRCPAARGCALRFRAAAAAVRRSPNRGGPCESPAGCDPNACIHGDPDCRGRGSPPAGRPAASLRPSATDGAPGRGRRPVGRAERAAEPRGDRPASVEAGRSSAGAADRRAARRRGRA